MRQWTREDFRMAREPLLGEESVEEHFLDLRPGRPLSGRIETSFGVERVEQDVERPLEPAVAEIVEASELAGTPEQRLLLQHGSLGKAALACEPHRGVHSIDETRAPRRANCRSGQVVVPLAVERAGRGLPLSLATLSARRNPVPACKACAPAAHGRLASRPGPA